MTMAAVWDSIAQCFAAVLSGSDADRRIAEAQLEQLQLAQGWLSRARNRQRSIN